ncbi:unnamed protein product [Sphagnum jensenii]
MKSCIDNIRVGDTLLIWYSSDYRVVCPDSPYRHRIEKFLVKNIVLAFPRFEVENVIYGKYHIIAPDVIVGIVKKQLGEKA